MFLLTSPFNSKLKEDVRMFRNQISLFVVTFLVVGLFFLVLPEKGFSGIGTGLGCCNTSISVPAVSTGKTNYIPS